MRDKIQQSLTASQAVMSAMLADTGLQGQLEAAVHRCTQALQSGRKLMFAGNGGSAAEAQHFSAEMVGRFLKERRPLPAIALHVDSSAVTAIGNDYGYEYVFSRQLEALAQPGDVLIAMSTSGRSKNILMAMQSARERQVITIGLTGQDPRDMGPLSDIVLAVPSGHTPQIQEGHLVLGHLLCGLTEDAILGE